MSHQAHLLSALFAIMVAPFIIWGMVFIAAQMWEAHLLRIVPWLRILSWVVYGVGSLVCLTALVSQRFWLVPFGVTTSSSGIIFRKMEHWVKRRYATDVAVT